VLQKKSSSLTFQRFVSVNCVDSRGQLRKVWLLHVINHSFIVSYMKHV